MPRNAKNPAQPNLFADVRSETAEVLSDPLAHLRRPLTKADLEKVRDVEGFPLGTDEDIIALSDPPYYTACPNPFLDEFIQAYGKAYDEVTDNYHREPFAADISEGKNDPIYNAHSYHTKVPYKAIMRYILHYTEPGDIVFDGFCGTGMTGVAAQMCGRSDYEDRAIIEAEMPSIRWGARPAMLCDLSPIAAFIAYNYNLPVDISAFQTSAQHILEEVESEFGWLYETNHIDGKTKGTINYTVWSDVYVCPECSNEFIYWDAAVNVKNASVADTFKCSNCGVLLEKSTAEYKLETVYDPHLAERITRIKRVPVLINYSVGKKRYDKRPDANDLAVIGRIAREGHSYWSPLVKMMHRDGDWGVQWRSSYHTGVTHSHHFFTPRNWAILSSVFAHLNEGGVRDRNFLKVWFTSGFSRLHLLNRYMPNHSRHVGPLSGTLYISAFPTEISPFYFLSAKLKDHAAINGPISNSTVVTTQSSSQLAVPSECVDYIFVDPPFGDNLVYSELNFLWEAWLQAFTNTDSEAIINDQEDKGLYEYQQLMTKCFVEFHRILKPGRWMTVEFHNSRNQVWNSIQEAILRSGFVVADVRTLDKEKGTTKQLTQAGTVKQDLVISAYKPHAAFEQLFLNVAGGVQGVWDFVREHLRQLPVFVETDGSMEVIAERQNYLLYDRMVAYYVQRGVSVPLSAAEFYAGLRNRFSERDSMFFLPEQVGEYDTKRALASQVEQLALFVNDKKSAVQWLRVALETERQTYQDLMPKFLQEVHQARHELLPELSQLLTENFLKDEKDFWYVPDSGRAEDLEKLRERGLLREFEGYQATKGKLKTFRTEAVRAGFKVAWARREYTTIVSVAQRLPEDVLQEDAALLMYYDNALMRQGA